MGTASTLSAISLSQNADNNGAVYGEDMIGMLSVAQVKASELITTLNSLVSRLPPGDPNIATINTLITNLS